MADLGLPSIVFFQYWEFQVCLEVFAELEFDCTDFLVLGCNCVSFYSNTDFMAAIDFLFETNCKYLIGFYAPPSIEENIAHFSWLL